MKMTTCFLLYAVLVAPPAARADCYPPGVSPGLALNDPAVRACAHAQLLRQSPNALNDVREADRFQYLQFRAFYAHDPDANAELSRLMRSWR
jgi:hypothetical protein